MHLYWTKTTGKRPAAVVTHSETVSQVDLNTFFIKFTVRFDKISKYAWKTLQHVCKNAQLLKM